MKTQLTRLMLACLLFSLLAAAPFLYAQEATPEATVDPEAESTQVIEAPNAPGAEEAETDSAIGTTPLTSGEQPGDITSGSSDETPEASQPGISEEAPEGDAETEEAVTSLEGAESTGEVEAVEAPAQGEAAPGITTLVLLLGIGAVFAVGLLTLTRGQFRDGSDDDTTKPQ